MAEQSKPEKILEIEERAEEHTGTCGDDINTLLQHIEKLDKSLHVYKTLSVGAMMAVFDKELVIRKQDMAAWLLSWSDLCSTGTCASPPELLKQLAIEVARGAIEECVRDGGLSPRLYDRVEELLTKEKEPDGTADQ